MDWHIEMRQKLVAASFSLSNLTHAVAFVSPLLQYIFDESGIIPEFHIDRIIEARPAGLSQWCHMPKSDRIVKSLSRL